MILEMQTLFTDKYNFCNYFKNIKVKNFQQECKKWQKN